VRVLIVNDWVRVEGGAEGYVRWLRGALEQAGDEVRLLTASSGSAAGGTADYVARSSERPIAQAALQVANPFAVSAMRRAVREFRPDVVLGVMFEMHLSPAVLLAAGAPVVLSVMYYKPFCPNGLKLLPSGERCTMRAGAVCRRTGCTGLAHWLRDRPRYHLIRSCLTGARAVVTCSEWMRSELLREGVPSTVLPPPAVAPAEGFVRVPSREPSFVFVGRLAREKGVASLLHAFALLRQSQTDARLVLVGDGPERASLEVLARELGLEEHVSFRGLVTAHRIDSEFANPWGLVVPSLWAEPFGIVALEGVVRRVPVIVSAGGGLEEIVCEGSSGLTFPAGDASALAERLARIASGTAFPTHVLDPAVAEEARERHDPHDHLARMRGVLAAAGAHGNGAAA
jgi:glycosyltransferase involved in cell wall biosynthesis